MAFSTSILCLFVGAFVAVTSNRLPQARKTVIIIHGILDGAAQMQDLKRNIENAYPGTVVHAIDLYDDLSSLTPMWTQVEKFRSKVRSIMDSSENRVTLIGFSQGGLVARGLIQTIEDHNVDTFIALSSPLSGQFGETSYLRKYFPTVLKEELYRVFYTWLGQKWSIANYWRDPHHLDQYHQYSKYLAQLNNETVPQSGSLFRSSWKKNFMKLKKLVLIGGPNDGVIQPWQSALFGCYDENENVINMRETRMYQEDSFGLKSLDENHEIVECVVHGVEHVKWHGNLKVFQRCLEPHLQ